MYATPHIRRLGIAGVMLALAVPGWTQGNCEPSQAALEQAQSRLQSVRDRKSRLETAIGFLDEGQGQFQEFNREGLAAGNVAMGIAGLQMANGAKDVSRSVFEHIAPPPVRAQVKGFNKGLDALENTIGMVFAVSEVPARPVGGSLEAAEKDLRSKGSIVQAVDALDPTAGLGSAAKKAEGLGRSLDAVSAVGKAASWVEKADKGQDGTKDAMDAVGSTLKALGQGTAGDVVAGAADIVEGANRLGESLDVTRQIASRRSGLDNQIRVKNLELQRMAREEGQATAEVARLQAQVDACLQGQSLRQTELRSPATSNDDYQAQYQRYLEQYERWRQESLQRSSGGGFWKAFGQIVSTGLDAYSQYAQTKVEVGLHRERMQAEMQERLRIAATPTYPGIVPQTPEASYDECPPGQSTCLGYCAPIDPNRRWCR